jgi:Na+-transporting NADH:ubiquinone oxidoreductase subunit NqrB
VDFVVGLVGSAAQGAGTQIGAGFTSVNALTTLLTVESLIFSSLSVATALGSSTSLARQARRASRFLVVSAASALTLVAVGAAAAWGELFLGHWPTRLGEQVPILCLAGGIIVQPGIAWVIAWLQVRGPRKHSLSV